MGHCHHFASSMSRNLLTSIFFSETTGLNETKIVLSDWLKFQISCSKEPCVNYLLLGRIVPYVTIFKACGLFVNLWNN
jgi:hypothetical protein